MDHQATIGYSDQIKCSLKDFQVTKNGGQDQKVYLFV